MPSDNRASMLSEGGGMSDFSDYKFDNLHLPPAGLSSGRLKHHWGKDTWTTPYVDFSLIQMAPAPEDNQLVGMRSMIDPAGYNLPAGTRSERVLHRKDYGMNDWEADDPKEFASKVKMKRSDEIRKFKIYTPQPRAKAVFSRRNHAKTDPITHFGTIYENKSAVRNYRPGRRYGYKNEAASNNWTWRQDKASLDHMNKHKTALTKTEQKFQVSVRGERQYNVCGTEDLLPAATVGFVKCDVPPPRDYITANDKKYLPYCARPFDSDAFQLMRKPPNIANESHQVWSCFRPAPQSEVGAKDVLVRETSSRGSVRSETPPSESSLVSQNSTAVATAGDRSRAVSAGPILRDRSLRPMSSGPTMRDRSRRHALQHSGGFPERTKDRGKASHFRNSDPAIRRSASALPTRRSRSTSSLVSCRSQSKLMRRSR